jgi:hypothetical protein
MIIYNTEKEDGLEEKILAQASISYASLAESSNNNLHKTKHIKSLAALNDSDLYYVQSILVSSSWNKNDDIFDKAEVWLARNTPEDKPTNLEHDENLIIGHITSNWPVTEEGILIDINTPIENLPNKYHILTGSVIYRSFSDPILRDRSEKLIAEIENGTKFVSMECFFKQFDYGLLNLSNNKYSILPRNESTAHLTKFLRAYGGAGQHEQYKIGRVLRDITFSGKGFVNKPANPDSIIFTLDNLKNTKSKDFGVIDYQQASFMEKNIMNSEQNNITPPATVSVVSEEIVEAVMKKEKMLEDKAMKMAEEKAMKMAEEKAMMEEEAMKMKAEFDAALQEAAETMAKKHGEDMKKKEEEMEVLSTKMKAELDEALALIAGYKSKEEEMMKKEKKMKRMASLSDIGLDNTVVDSFVNKFESLDDDAFAAMSELLVAQKTKFETVTTVAQDTTTEVLPEKNETSASSIVSEEILETVEVEPEVTLSVGGEDSAVEHTRAELIEFIRGRLSKTH